MKKYWPELAVSLLLVAAVLAVYLQTIRFELVHVEDFVFYNELSARLKANGFPLLGIFQMPSNAVYLVPVTNFMGFLDIWLCGDNIGMLHFLPALIHATDAVLLFFILRIATVRTGPSAVTAALFALHPINAENVASWCRAPTLIVSFFFMLTFLSYLYYARSPSVKRRCLVIICFIMGLLSKPTIVYLPFLLLLFDFWPLGRWPSKQSRMESPRFATGTLADLILEKVPLFIILAVWMCLFIIFFRLGPALPAYVPPPEDYRHWFNLPVAYVLYLWKFFNPFDFPLYIPDSLSPPFMLPLWQIITASAVLLFVTAAVIRGRNQYPFFFSGWFWFVISLAPYAVACVSQQKLIISRYAYLPMIGICFFCSWGGACLQRKTGLPRWFVFILSVALLIFLMTTSWIQAGRWSDKITYFRHAVSVYPDCELRRLTLGEALRDQGRIDEAITQLETALRINACFFVAHNHLGLALMRRGDREGALDHFKKAVSLNPGYQEAHNNLANLLVDMGNLDDAIIHYHEALEIDPSLFQVHNNLATALARKGLYDQAVFHFKKALSINPAYRVARDNLTRIENMRKKQP